MVCIIMGIVVTTSADTQVTMGLDQAAFEKRWSLYTGGHKDRFHCITN